MEWMGSSHHWQIIILLIIIVSCHHSTGQQDVKRRNPSLDSTIMKHLFNQEYDKRAIPRVDNQALTIKVGFTLVQLHSLDEKNQMLTSSGWFQMEWTDYRLAWNKSEYDRDHIVVPSRDIWLPDIGFLNSASIYHQSMIKNEFRCVLYSDGSVLWVPGGTYYTTCELDISNFPFDSQTCELHLTNWAYNLAEMNLTTSSNKIHMSSYKYSAEWEITSTFVNRTEVVYECCGNIAYPSLFFHITIERKSLYYIVNILIPCIILSVIATFTFCVPPVSGEKVSLGITLLLSFTVFQLIVAESIPRRSDSVPIISLYISTITMTVTASIICTILVTRVHYMGSVPIPYWVRRFTFDFLARAVFLNDLSKEFGSASWCKGSNSILRNRASSEKRESSIRLKLINGHVSEDMLAQETPCKPEATAPVVEFNNNLIQRTNNHVEHILEYLKEYGKRRSGDDTTELLQAQWRAAALVFDRFFFLLFVTLTFIITTIFLIPSRKNRNDS